MSLSVSFEPAFRSDAESNATFWRTNVKWCELSRGRRTFRTKQSGSSTSPRLHEPAGTVELECPFSHRNTSTSQPNLNGGRRVGFFFMSGHNEIRPRSIHTQHWPKAPSGFRIARKTSKTGFFRLRGVQQPECPLRAGSHARDRAGQSRVAVVAATHESYRGDGSVFAFKTLACSLCFRHGCGPNEARSIGSSLG